QCGPLHPARDVRPGPEACAPAPRKRRGVHARGCDRRARRELRAGGRRHPSPHPPGPPPPPPPAPRGGPPGRAARLAAPMARRPDTAGARPCLTAVTLCYNHERFVAEALESVRAQGCDDIQLVVIDDCSTDGSVAAVRDWIARTGYPCELVVHSENVGLVR